MPGIAISGIVVCGTVVGLCAASHIRDGHDLKLRDAGRRVHLAHSWSDVERVAHEFFKNSDAPGVSRTVVKRERMTSC